MPFGFEELFGAFERLAAVEAELPAVGQEMAEQMATAMRDELGTYQAGWPELSEATQAQRTAAGYTPNDPLLRSGAMQEAIHAWQCDDGEWRAGIPADDPTAVYAAAQEFGTVSGTVVPPRPFVGPIASDYGQHVADAVSAKVEEAL